MPLCSDEIYWGKIATTNLPLRPLTTVVHFEPIFLSESSLVEFGIWGYAALNLENFGF